MYYVVLAALSEPNNGPAALAVLVSGYAVLVSVFLVLVEDPAHRRKLGYLTVGGVIVVCGFGLVKPALGLYFAMALLVAFGLATVLASRGESAISLPNLPQRLRESRSLKRAIMGFTLAFAVAAALVVGLLIGKGGGDSHPTVVARPGPYHVANTCFDGVCTVNVCRTPKRCGEGGENVGELKEGTAIEIQCQTLGGAVHGAQKHDRSRIWDRLSTGFYISDVFVEETRTGRFTNRIQNCANA